MENSGLSSTATSSSLHGLDAAVTDSLDKHGDSCAVEGKRDPSGTLPPLDGVENNGSSSSPDNNMPTVEDAIDEETIGVPLLAGDGLHRSLTKKFPKTGPRTYGRRNLPTLIKSKSYFPELSIIRKTIPSRIPVLNGLDAVVKPDGIPIDDAEWFKRLTGRHEVAISPQDYKFHTPRDGQKLHASNSASHIPASTWPSSLQSYKFLSRSSSSFSDTGFDTDSGIEPIDFDTDSETDDSPTEAAGEGFGSNAQKRKRGTPDSSNEAWEKSMAALVENSNTHLRVALAREAREMVREERENQAIMNMDLSKGWFQRRKDAIVASDQVDPSSTPGRSYYSP